MSIGRRLKNRRLLRGFTQEQVAAATGIRQESISAIETGKFSNPKIRNLHVIAEFLGISLDDLCRPAGIEPPNRLTKEEKNGNGSED